VRLLVEGKQRELNPVLRDEIYRIGREALRNAFRHARAKKIEAKITYRDSEFQFHMRDDGIGIAPEVANQGARRWTLGLAWYARTCQEIWRAARSLERTGSRNGDPVECSCGHCLWRLAGSWQILVLAKED
jgi:hypothetical protein